ncbi:MAG: Multidrug resistance protein MdtC [Phycisphaerae bacterium]|nr:Multidrug resistance protein MdtC [Phycisphaerae bacterium]
MKNSSVVQESPGRVDRIIRFCLENKLVVFLLLGFIVLWGYRVMPFRTPDPIIPRDPIPVDAFPDIGENQQIVFTDWPGRSPQDVEDQVTYPLTTLLQGTPGFKTVRAFSMFGFSIIYVIFDEHYDFYWCRSRILEKLNVAQQILPPEVTPQLGPDATGLGQVYWYTLEGSQGGFDLMELRSVQDWYVRYALQSIPGVSEVASVGGYVREYQIDVDPDAMRAHQIKLQDIFMAVQRANIDVGAETIEFNGVEYIVRGRGFIKGTVDVENIVLRVTDNVPIYVKNVAQVQIGPALRRGLLDKEGLEAVGGVVLVRYGANPMEVIERVKERILEISANLPQKILQDGTTSQVQIVPFYDRTVLIDQTLGTLHHALIDEILITMFVVIIFIMHFRSAFLICLNLPVAIMMAFILMKVFKIDSNLMSLGGIAIAIGTMVDMGIILCENIIRHLDESPREEPVIETIYRASSEVGSAVVTAIATTVISFLPVFAMVGPEGKLFRPLAYTKTFCLLASVVVALTILPALAHLIFEKKQEHVQPWRLAGWWIWRIVLFVSGALGGLYLTPAAWPLVVYAIWAVVEPFTSARAKKLGTYVSSYAAAAGVLYLLTLHWMPLGLGAGLIKNLIFVFVLNILWLSLRLIFIDFYPYFLSLFLRHKALFLSVPLSMLILGGCIWLGFGNVFAWLPTPSTTQNNNTQTIYQKVYAAGVHTFPGMGREFMPPLDEGSFLYMPTLMPHAGIGPTLEAVSAMDQAIRAIPEVENVVGKIGRAETAIDPAPISMIETIIQYKPEYQRDTVTGELVLDENDQPIRQWREHIKSPKDIWSEIQKAAEFPGATGAPHLQPIAARLVMLQSGMRASMGVKVYGNKLEDIEQAGYQIAEALKTVPSIAADAVIPDRVVGKPYLEINIDREKIARYGVNIRDIQDVIEIALGGIRATTTVEGRERYPVRVRYLREIRDNVEAMERILVPGVSGEQIPLAQLARIEYVRGPQEIKTEDNFLVSYVLFDKTPGWAEVNVVEEADRVLKNKISNKELILPEGVHYAFSGSYEGQLRFQKELLIMLPTSLFLIFLILYFQFRSVPVSLLVFLAIAVVWSGGFIGLWLTAQPWFLDFDVLGRNVREVFNMRVYNLSTAVWIGFIALFGIATDDGVVITTYLNHIFKRKPTRSIDDIRAHVIEAGNRRVRPCLMTTTTTVLALLPVITNTGRGADVMIPMALPGFWGMTLELITLFTVPVSYCLLKEWLWKLGMYKNHFQLEKRNGIDPL